MLIIFENNNSTSQAIREENCYSLVNYTPNNFLLKNSPIFNLTIQALNQLIILLKKDQIIYSHIR